MADILVFANGWLDGPWGTRIRCALGRGGVRYDKCEGDGVTPVGCFPLRRVLYRADRIAVPQTALPIEAMRTYAGWCDDPADPAYNCMVALPYAARHEVLWRADNLYDIIVVLGCNDDPIVPGMGSAIFWHIAQADYTATAGCVAITLPDMLQALAWLAAGDRLCVRPFPA